MIRRCDTSDLPWLLEWAWLHYADWISDAAGLGNYLDWAVSDPDILVLRVGETAMFAHHFKVFFEKESQVQVQFFAGKAREVIALFRETLKWAKGLGAHGIEFQPRTGMRSDKLARILGAVPGPQTYVWEG